MPKKKTTGESQSTSQSIGSLIKSCRDIMRKDKGLSTDLDRLPMLTWIMFLKFLDDMEKVRETEASLEGKRFRPSVESPYRWRDWASKPEGITGDALISFINNEEATLPNGKRGTGLFAYLRSLQGTNGGDRRDVIRTVFQGTVNRMINGYLLRDIINKVDGIHFTSTEEIFTLGHLYESMLQEMRDAAGENGEFYTPRPLVKFIVTVVNPRLGESILDPACGTGGFLAESFEHVKKQCKTAEDHRRLQRETLSGIEAKPLPYLLCQMNMLLHGVETPNIDPLNALRFPLREIGDKDRVDIIMTNPPFGGEEERGIQGNFPEDKKTAETALLFLQLIMRKLRRQPKPGRAAVVVPNGTLFGDGVCARIKEELLMEFNLETIVRLPQGVFAPYTAQETAVLFFRRGGPTEHIWYYQHPLPADRLKLKNPCYIKTKPLIYEEFAPLLSWWKNRVENDLAWKVNLKEITDNKFDLDIRHPSKREPVIIKTRIEVSESINSAINELENAAKQLTHTIFESSNILPAKNDVKLKRLNEFNISFNPENRNPELSPDEEFLYVDLSSVSYNSFNDIRSIKGNNAPSRARRVIRTDDVILSTVRPYLCGHAVVTENLHNQICSTGFSVLRCNENINPKFLYYMLITPQVIYQYHSCMRGAHYPALKDLHVRNLLIPEISILEQEIIVNKLDRLTAQINAGVIEIDAFSRRLIAESNFAISALLADVYGKKKDIQMC